MEKKQLVRTLGFVAIMFGFAFAVLFVFMLMGDREAAVLIWAFFGLLIITMLVREVARNLPEPSTGQSHPPNNPFPDMPPPVPSSHHRDSRSPDTHGLRDETHHRRGPPGR